jgi:hypothetical protein
MSDGQELIIRDEFADHLPAGQELIVPGSLPDLSKGESLDLTVRQLIRHMAIHYLEVGGLLAEIYEGKMWSVSGYDRWKDYVESLGVGSYTYVMSLISISKMIAAAVLSREDLDEIGYSKVCLLVPLINKGKITDEILSIARTGNNRDLRIAVGYKVSENDGDCSVICSNCGFELHGAQWVRKE